jgi:hypothetical protein
MPKIEITLNVKPRVFQYRDPQLWWNPYNYFEMA